MRKWFSFEQLDKVEPVMNPLKRRTPYKTMLYHADRARENHLHTRLAQVSGTSGWLFKVAQLINAVHVEFWDGTCDATRG